MTRIIITILFLFPTFTIAEDMIIVKGGRQIRGQVTGETETHVDIFTDYGKQLHIHRTRIGSMTRSGTAVDPNTVPLPQRETAAFIEAKKEGPRFGIQLGVASSGVSIDPAPTTAPNSKSGLMIGAVGEFQLNELFFFQPELIYVQSGFKESTTTTVKYNFIKIPLQAKLKYPMSETIHLNGLLGASLSFLSSAQSETSSAGTAATVTDLKSNTKSTIFGVEIGGGATYVFSPSVDVFMNLRYSMGLNNLNATIGSTSTVKLHDFGVLAGVLYRL